MTKFMRNTKGAISIFLVLVMVPMMMVSSVFVDMSRINLAKSMAASAGDLTANTALSNYDSELKTIYGLFATAQNMDEMMDSLEEYYRKSIVAAGVDEDFASDFAGNLVNVVKAETGTDDLMNIQLAGLDVEIPKGADLGNPAILKTQIVEFMKYRAPLNLGMGLISSLTNLKSLNSQMDVVENKNAFYEQHQNLLGYLEDAWKELQEYQYKDAIPNTGFPTGSYITDKAGELGKKAAPLKTAIVNTVCYLYDNDNFKKVNSKISLQYKCPECGAASKENDASCACGATWDIKTGNQVWKVTWNDGKEKEVTPKHNASNPASIDDVLQAYNKVLTKINDIKNFEKETDIHQKVLNCNSSDQVVEIYLACQLYRASKSDSSYLQAVKDLLQCLVNLNSALLTCEDENLEKTKIKEGSGGQWHIDNKKGTKELLNLAITQLNSHLKLEGKDYIGTFNSVARTGREFVDDNTQTVSDKKNQVKKALSEARSAAKPFYDKIDEKVKNLSNALTSLDKVQKMLNGTDDNAAYTTARNAWETSAKNLGDDTMGQRDQDELNDLKKIITAKNVSALITRLTEAKKALESVRTAIDGHKICGTSWRSLAEEPTFKTMIGLIQKCPNETFDSTITKIQPSSTNSYDEVVGKIQKKVITQQVPTQWEASKGPNLSGTGTQLYSWMYNNFYDPDRNYDSKSTTKEVNSSDKQLSDSTKDIEGAKGDKHSAPADVGSSGGTDTNRSMKKFLEAKNGLPSTRWKGTKNELPKAEIQSSSESMLKNDTNGNFLKQIMNIAGNLGRDLRDNLYVSEYIMTMFSYDTIEAEIYDQKSTDSDYEGDAFFEKQDDGTYEASEKYAKYAAELETLTNVPLDPDMNYLYGGEVEYILYGQGGETAVYATIFALRFALNTVYAFTDAEINNVTLSAATALFGTPPLTPLIPVAKVAMTIALALAESGWDLNELSKGKAIPLMKNKQTWIMSPSGLAKQVKTEAVAVSKKLINKGVEKGYEALNNALTATSDELDEMIKQGTVDLKELASAAVESSLGSVKNYANEAVLKVVELCNQQNQLAMLDSEFDKTVAGAKNFGGDLGKKVQNVYSELENWKKGQTDDDPVVLQAKKIAADYLMANGGQKIKEVFAAIEEQASLPKTMSVEEATAPLDKLLDEIRGEIESSINSLITKGGESLQKMKDDMEGRLREAAKDGAEKLKSKLSSEVDRLFGNVPTNNAAPQGAANGVVSSLLSWRYSDYLRIFVVVGLFANEELMLLRIADMIERNMQHKNNEEVLVTTTEEVTKSRFFGLWKYKTTKEVASISSKAFTLSKSYTYVKLTAHLQVKPLMMTLPFMADVTENKLTSTNWYEIEHTTILGY